MKVAKMDYDYDGIKDVIVVPQVFFALIAAPTSSVIFSYGISTLLARVCELFHNLLLWMLWMRSNIPLF